jgi:hypothetical protein
MIVSSFAGPKPAGLTNPLSFVGLTNPLSFAGLTGESKRIILDEEALTVVRRARNHKPKTVPKNADPVEYKMATALEALIGYLTLEGRDDEAQALIELSMQIIDRKE